MFQENTFYNLQTERFIQMAFTKKELRLFEIKTLCIGK